MIHWQMHKGIRRTLVNALTAVSLITPIEAFGQGSQLISVTKFMGDERFRITSKEDGLEIQKTVINRGRCVPQVEHFPIRLNFGETRSFQSLDPKTFQPDMGGYLGGCYEAILEIIVTTNKGDVKSTWDH